MLKISEYIKICLIQKFDPSQLIHRFKVQNLTIKNYLQQFYVHKFNIPNSTGSISLTTIFITTALSYNFLAPTICTNSNTTFDVNTTFFKT